MYQKTEAKWHEAESNGDRVAGGDFAHVVHQTARPDEVEALVVGQLHVQVELAFALTKQKHFLLFFSSVQFSMMHYYLPTHLLLRMWHVK